MVQTVFIYSSHNCSKYIHEEKIVQRALSGWKNKRILFLPISETPHSDGNEFSSQEFGFNKFNWFFKQYVQYGLETVPFYYSKNLQKEDADTLIELMRTSEVLILGGGNPQLGMRRYREIGAKFYNNSELFRELLHERMANGLYTVGFSAGADQLCELLSSSAFSKLENPYGFGLAKNITVSLHHDSSRRGDLYHLAEQWGHCLAFGLPNDSGIGVSSGWLNSGKMFQIIEFVIDLSWDIPNDAFHIKTRQGEKIDHYYTDGRHWSFNGGNQLVRIMDPATEAQEAWIVFSKDNIIDYWTQQKTNYISINHILANH